MPFQKGHKINEGNHNVGRKSTADEYSKNEAIQKAWNKVNNEIEDNPVKDIALPIALKTMTDKQDIMSGGEKLNPVLVKFINGEDKDD